MGEDLPTDSTCRVLIRTLLLSIPLFSLEGEILVFPRLKGRSFIQISRSDKKGIDSVIID